MKLETKWQNLIDDNSDIYVTSKDMIVDFVNNIHKDIEALKKDEDKMSVYTRKRRWLDAWNDYYVNNQTYAVIGENRGISKNGARRLVKYINRSIRLKLIEHRDKVFEKMENQENIEMAKY